VFEIKARPKENPLIVHVATIAQAKALAADWTREARLLAERFWPGPLTLVLKRSSKVLSEVAAGLDTVAIRMPSHRVARAIIEAAERPVAAPSANRFMGLSATRAEHVDPELAAKVDLIVDGGHSQIGLESTVVDVTVSPPRILRPGGITRGEIQAALGAPLGSVPPQAVRASPGMYRRHYAPKAEVRLVRSLNAKQLGLTFSEPKAAGQVKMPNDPVAYGAALYDALHRLDRSAPKTIFIESPPDKPEWEAVWDRLRKASARSAA
jgi:L-threonylcarbamoyladenylate synthase